VAANVVPVSKSDIKSSLGLKVPPEKEKIDSEKPGDAKPRLQKAAIKASNFFIFFSSEIIKII
jgi:hypothetical protein